MVSIFTLGSQEISLSGAQKLCLLQVKEAVGSGSLPMSAPVITPLPRDPRKRARGVKGDATATDTASSEQGRGSSSMYFAAASNQSTPQRHHERASPAGLNFWCISSSVQESQFCRVGFHFRPCVLALSCMLQCESPFDTVS